MSDNRVERIENRLSTAFSPEYLLVKDQSHLHAGHEGAKDGRGHFDVTITSAAFDGCSRIDAHRKIYTVLDDLMQSDIHALAITIRNP